MRLVFAGTPAVALPALDALVESDHDVLAVITRADARAGRSRELRASPVSRRADELGIPALKPVRAIEVLDELRRLAPECAAVVAYGQILPPALLEIPIHGWVNLHFSLLPSWRGAAPVQHAIRHGDDVTGATTFRLDAGMDTGPVYGVVTEPVGPRDTAGDVLGRLSRSGAGLLRATVDGIDDGSLVAVPQRGEGVSYAPKIETADARVDWTQPAIAIDRLIRSCTPLPGAWTTCRGQRLGLGPVAIEHGVHLPSAKVVSDGRTVTVGTATGAVRLGDVRPAGRRTMAADEWARGARLQESETVA